MYWSTYIGTNVCVVGKILLLFNKEIEKILENFGFPSINSTNYFPKFSIRKKLEIRHWWVVVCKTLTHRKCVSK